MVADRQDALTGQTNQLIREETQFALNMAKEGNGNDPELVKTLFNLRAQLKPSEELGSIREAVAELRSIATALRVEPGNRAALELAVIEKPLRTLQQTVSDQTKATNGLLR